MRIVGDKDDDEDDEDEKLRGMKNRGLDVVLTSLDDLKLLNIDSKLIIFPLHFISL